MTITQERFLDKFAQQLVDKGFCRAGGRYSVTLTKYIKLSDSSTCKIEISWLYNSWPVVKTRIRMGGILSQYDVTVGLLMNYNGGVDDILEHIVKQAAAGVADIIIKQL